MTTRTTLKTHFVTGATPTEAQFADLIDSAVNVTDDLTAQLDLSDSTKVLTAAGAKALKDSLDAVDTRVTTLENAGNTFASNYYNKAEVDTSISVVSGTVTSVGNVAAAARAVLEARIAALEASDADDAEDGHTHSISGVVGLQSELDLKASMASIADLANTISAGLGTKADSSHTHVMADITDLSGLTGFATTADLATKADVSHNHTASEVTGLGDTYYSKTEVDTRIAAVDTEHTHTESQITDLDKYTQSQTDLRIADHDNLTNNPHSVNKTQVGLGLVENLDTAGIFNSSAANTFVSQNVTPVNDSIVSHAANVSNPHAVTKTQVGLGNVPNVDVEALLAAHEAASNPHNINLSFFDVFSKAETNTRIEYYISTKIYNFTPTSVTDSAGALGDIAFDSGRGLNGSPAHIKVGSTAWESLAPTDDPVFTTKITTPEVTAGGSHLKIGSNTNDLFVFLSTGGAPAESLQITRLSGGNIKYTANGGSGSHEFSGDVDITGTYLKNGQDIIADSIATAISDLIDGAPAALDTLNELAAAINDDDSFATTVTNLITANTTALSDHEADTANPHSVTKTQVSLGNVDNVQQTPLSYRETDVSLGSNSDDAWASVKAIRAYVLANSYAGP